MPAAPAAAYAAAPASRRDRRGHSRGLRVAPFRKRKIAPMAMSSNTPSIASLPAANCRRRASSFQRRIAQVFPAVSAVEFSVRRDYSLAAERGEKESGAGVARLGKEYHRVDALFAESF